MIKLVTQENAVLLPVKIVPGASRTRYLGEWQGHAKIAVAAPPERGKANRAVIDFVAALLDTRRRDVTIVMGLTSPQKIIRIEGLTIDAVNAALQAPRS